MEANNTGFEPVTSHVLSERSTTELVIPYTRSQVSILAHPLGLHVRLRVIGRNWWWLRAAPFGHSCRTHTGTPRLGFGGSFFHSCFAGFHDPHLDGFFLPAFLVLDTPFDGLASDSLNN